MEPPVMRNTIIMIMVAEHLHVRQTKMTLSIGSWVWIGIMQRTILKKFGDPVDQGNFTLIFCIFVTFIDEAKKGPKYFLINEIERKTVTVSPSGTAKMCHCKQMAYTVSL